MNSSATVRSGPTRSQSAANASVISGSGSFSSSPVFRCRTPNARAMWQTVRSFSSCAASRSATVPQPVMYSTSRMRTP